MKTPKKFVFFIISMLITFSIMETSLRIAGNIYLKNLYVHTEGSRKISPNETNIICLGESSTAGLGVDWEDSYPSQLKAMLKKQYPKKAIDVIVPPHVGQNTSQVANRIDQYIELYSPRLIILMIGYNNEWSLAESRIGKFLESDDLQTLKVRALCSLNNLRLFKMLRYFYLRSIVKEESDYMQGLKGTGYLWGGPELVRWPPQKWTYSFAHEHRDAFIRLWRYDVQEIISAAQKHSIDVLLMTYHINPTYLPLEEFISMAHKNNIPLVRNDKTFQILIENRTIHACLLGDNWHPNKYGYTFIAKNALQVIQDEKLLDE